ncbi:MAG: PKD domain-containing protein, partial [Candidatus Korobacteraceae bacterium]
LNKMSNAVRYVPGNQAPIASLVLSPASGTAPLTVSASTTGSSDPDGNVASSNIDFGDGTVASGASALHIYKAPGTYTVQATVYDNAGVYTVSTKQVVVQPASAGISISSPDGSVKESSPIRVQAAVSWARPIRDLSVFIDGERAFTTFTSQVDRKFEVKDGAHIVELKATDDSGVVIRATRNITTQTPNLPPVAVLNVGSFSGSLPNQVLACTAASSDSDGGISNQVVEFGDSTVRSGAAIVHTYATPGTYKVTATITDARGLSSATEETVTVGAKTTPGSSALFRLTAAPEPSPSSVQGSQARYVINATPQSGEFQSDVALSCPDLPAGLACSFQPVRIRPGASGASSVLTIAIIQAASSAKRLLLLSALAWPVVGLLIQCRPGGLRRRARYLGVFATLAISGMFVACGTGGVTGSDGSQSTQTYTVTVTGTSGTMQSSTTVQFVAR